MAALACPAAPWGWGVLGVAVLGVGLFFFLPASPFKKRQRKRERRDFTTKGCCSGRGSSVQDLRRTKLRTSSAKRLARDVPGTSLFARTIARAYVREQFGRDPLESAERRNVNIAYNGLRSKARAQLAAPKGPAYSAEGQIGLRAEAKNAE